MKSFVAIRSFATESAAREAESRLASMGVRCSILAKHPNLIDHAWLFVSAEFDVYGQQTLSNLPSGALGKSVKVAGIEESEIPAYAVKAVERSGRGGSVLWWLLVFLWPVSFGWTNPWTYISLLGCAVALGLLAKATIGCPCCGKLALERPKSSKTVQCAQCGIRCDIP